MKTDEAQEVIREAIQKVGPSDDDHRDCVLTHFVVVSAWMDPNGETWLAKITGPEGMPSYQSTGLLHEALFNDWERKEDDE